MNLTIATGNADSDTLFRQREPERERGANALLAYHVNRPAMLLNDPLRSRQPEPGSGDLTDRIPGPRERLKDMG
jgi:hypothetical protein